MVASFHTEVEGYFSSFDFLALWGEVWGFKFRWSDAFGNSKVMLFQILLHRMKRKRIYCSVVGCNKAKKDNNSEPSSDSEG